MMTIGVYLLIALGAFVLGAFGLVVVAWLATKDDDEMLHHWEQMQGSLDDD